MKKKKQGVRFLYILLILLSGAILFNSCRKDDDDIDRHEDNLKFHELMDDWYYWYDKMPQVNPRTYPSPYELLEALRYRPDDRWSYITSRREFEAYFRESKFVGYGFGSAFDSDGKLRITFVYSSSDLYENDIRRGWIIEKVNGTEIQPGTNINQLLGPNEEGVSIDFVFRAPEADDPVEFTFVKKELVMNTVLHWGVIEAAGKKIGHLVFQGFTGPSLDELDEAFAEFQAVGIDDLILDLRYNGGGQTNVASYLASMIGGANLAGEPFADYQYNDKRAEEENFTHGFDTVQINLGLDRLITITTRSTASASEMVINGLRPFLPVFIIGDDTYGKPMGANGFYWNSYAFVPITFKITNADGDGEYFDGLQANSYVADDVTKPFDDPDEASLKEALNFIETDGFSGIARTKSLFIQPREQMRGLRREIGAH